VTASFPPAPPQPSSPQDNADDAPGLDAMLDTVLQELELSAPLRGAHLSVEIADPLIHFDVAEGDFGTQSDRQLQAIAVACAAELLGDAAGEHEVRWSLQAGARQLLIAAVPRPLIEMLDAAARSRGLRLESVQPGFARRWNAFARTLNAETAVFAATSGRHAVVACVVDRAMRALSIGPWQDEHGRIAAEGPASRDAAAGHAPGTSLLDARAARLLASLGIAAGADAQYLLVADDPAAASAAPAQWSVVGTPEVAA
jgi:hypothetical protein